MAAIVGICHFGCFGWLPPNSSGSVNVYQCIVKAGVYYGICCHWICSCLSVLTAIFPGKPWLAFTSMSPFWILLKLRIMEVC